MSRNVVLAAAFAAVPCVFGIATADAATLNVSQSGANNPNCAANPCQTIQFAINQAQGGDTVLVGPGAYFENVALKSGVHLLSNDRATIRGNGQSQVVLVAQTGPGTIIEGFIITGGNNVADGEAGGGVRVVDGAVEIRRNVIRGNSNDYAGGGITLINASAIVVNNAVSSNSGQAAGGIAVLDSPFVSIVNNTIAVNQSLSSASLPLGDSISVHQSGNVLIQNNILIGSGGNVPAVGASVMSSAPTLNNNLFAARPVFGDESGMITDLDALNATAFAEGNVGGSVQFYAFPDDLHLLSGGGEAIDAGLLANAPSVDFDGSARPSGAGVDIGFDEWVDAFPCSDGIDNDGDGLVDRSDPGCVDMFDGDEGDGSQSRSCNSTVADLDDLRPEVDRLATSSLTKKILTTMLSAASLSRQRGQADTARAQIGGFALEAVVLSNPKVGTRNGIQRDAADSLACGAANVLKRIR